MTYAKAMAAIKSYPYPIKSAKEASAILGVGEKIASQCEEYVKTGKIAAAGEQEAMVHKSFPTALLIMCPCFQKS